MIEFLVILLFCFFAEILLQKNWIIKMRKLKIEQVSKLYGPSWHEKTKAGTPTMGGIVFIPIFLMSIALMYCVEDLSPNEFVYQIATYTVAVAAIGLIDDLLKYIRKSGDGLKSLQKLFLQIVVTVPWVMWVLPEGLELFPGFTLPYLPSILLAVFAGVGFQNAVNVTDGLDGLLAGSMLISFIATLLFFINDPFISWVLTAAIGILLGFLWQNSNPAEVFMGDVGSHFFAALLFAVTLCSGVFIVIIPVGFIFGIEIISVAIQIFSIRCLNRKVFLMSPIHHHFEMMGWKENQIVMRFWIIHIIGMLFCFFVLAYLVFLI